MPESIKTARDAVSLVASVWGINDYIPRVVVSELVTNAVRHSAPDDHIVVRAYQMNGKRFIEVWDQADGMPRTQTPAETDECGRGLILLSFLVERWGVRPLNERGKVVYAELRP
ncbi:ATP-binding protein [Actinomadura sp. KC345]|uniref:ATP-binding protein n=1 Tax=Actinomadura sp. KC345 TaxID=2530371 RepID=UPI001A9E188F|nr:ATP-binding protein [Actinomadura sp. KC345]